MPVTRLLLVIALTNFLAAPLAAQQLSSPPSDPAPASITYLATVTFDLPAAAIEVDATLNVGRSLVQAGGVALLLNAELEILEVSGPAVRGHSVQPSGYTPAWNLVTVQLAAIPAGQVSLPIRLHYRGVPGLPSDGINSISPEWVELNLDSQWFPVAATLDQEMTGEVRLRLPEAWQVVASGEVSRSGDVHLLRTTVPQVDVAFSAGPSLEREAGDRFTVVSRTADPRTRAIVLAATDDCARHYNSLAGDGARFPGGRIVLAGRQGPGYARKNYIVLSEVDTAQVERLQFFLCHEIFHYWTRSPGAQSPDHWISEAFAEYAAGRFLRVTYGPESFEVERRRWEAAGRDHGPVWTPELTGRPSFQAMYRRGPFLLSRLEDRIGTERFEQLLRRFMIEGIQRTPALLEAVAAVAGNEAAEWFRGELSGTG